MSATPKSKWEESFFPLVTVLDSKWSRCGGWWRTEQRAKSVTQQWGFFSCVLPILFWKSNSPLVSGHLPFLFCHRSDVSHHPHVSYSLRLVIAPITSLSTVFIVVFFSLFILCLFFGLLTFFQCSTDSQYMFIAFCFLWLWVIFIC